MAPTMESQQSLADALQDLYETLDKAFWVASTIEAKDMIRGLSEAVFDALTDLNRLDISSRTTDYQPIKTSITRINAKLDTLKSQIDQLVHEMQIAAQVAAAIDTAVSAAAKFFV